MGWWQRRRERKARTQRFWARMEEEQRLAYAEGGEKQREIEAAARSLGRPQIQMRRFALLYTALLVVCVVPLIVLFALIKHWTG